MPDPKVLADKPVADRRGDDVLDRHVHHVIDHPAPAAKLTPGETEDEADEANHVDLDKTSSLPQEKNHSTTLGDDLPKQMARVRDIVIPQYQSIGAAGRFATAVMKTTLDRAAKAMVEGDLPAMISAYKELKDMKS